MMKIATLTYQRHDNYGAMLQCYALQKKIEELGFESEVIDYICDVSEKPFSLKALKAKGIKRYITGSIGAITRLPRAKRFKEFRKLIKMSKPVVKQNISQLGSCYDGYIVGSDNVWNADITGLDERYFLSFVFDKRKRASYAASFGSSKIKPEHREKYAKLLNDFSQLTNREHSGATLINELTGRHADVVCDPSLLLTYDDWANLANEPNESYPYLLAYQMVPSRAFVNFVNEVAQKKNLRVIYIPFPYGSIKCKSKPSIGPLEWLGLFKNAEFIVTDSFHGCAFSVLFQKEFCVKILQLGERIENLLGILDIKERVVNSVEDVLALNKIDYVPVTERLETFRQESTERLKTILNHFAELKHNGLTDPSSCTGCLLCKKICPADAINLKKDELGFIHPDIDEEKCIHCNKCENVCLSLSSQKNDAKTGEQKYFAAINNNKEIVENSGAGGVFHALAKSILAERGVVYGAAYQDCFKISHASAENEAELKQLMGTKYTQSYIFDIFEDVKNNLINGRKVLFVGTPCQCGAVKEYLKLNSIDTQLFYCCDSFCHGVFSPEIWEKYVEFLQKKFDKKLTYISFRDKKKGWRNKHLKITNENQDISDFCNDNASVLRIYQQNIALRTSCYQCNYMNFDRCGDISIGDFWGIERIMPKIDNNTGVSAVIVTTPKGKQLFEQISNEIKVFGFAREQIEQQVLREPTKQHSQRNSFISDYANGGVEQILGKYGQVKGKLKFKRDFFVPFLYKLRLAGLASKILHRND